MLPQLREEGKKGETKIWEQHLTLKWVFQSQIIVFLWRDSSWRIPTNHLKRMFTYLNGPFLPDSSVTPYSVAKTATVGESQLNVSVVVPR